MFGSSRKGNDEVIGTDIETIIGKNTQIKGIISGGSNIRIDGSVEGEITVTGDIVVGEQGVVTASIKAANVLISGTVRGNVEVGGKLEILGTGKLCGDVKVSVLSISEGAIFKGNSNMGQEKEIPKETENLETKHK